MNSIFDLLNAGNDTQVGQMPDINLPWLNQQPQQQEPQSMGISNLSQRIQELLGAKEPAQGGMAGDILSSRFGNSLDTGYGDYANGVVQSAMGKPTLGPQVADTRISNMADIGHKLGQMQYYQALSANGGTKSSTMAVANALIAQGVDPITAISFAKSGIGTGMTMQGNQVVPINGAPQAQGAMAYGKEAGQQRAEVEAAQPKATNAAYGKDLGERKATLNTIESSLPQLETTVTKLGELGKKATYTLAGQAKDAAARQMGFGGTEGAQARQEYINTVRNVLFPQLRATFGAQFTAKEGEALIATLGDPDLSPEEKDASLRAFLDQKKQTIGSMQRELGQPNTMSSGPGRLIGTSGGKKVYQLPDGSHVMEQ
jgi:hypothetical protein